MFYCPEQTTWLTWISRLEVCNPHAEAALDVNGYYTGWHKSGFRVVSMQNTEFTLVLLFINYCTIFYMNNCKLAFALHCIVPTFCLKDEEAPVIFISVP